MGIYLHEYYVLSLYHALVQFTMSISILYILAHLSAQFTLANTTTCTIVLLAARSNYHQFKANKCTPKLSTALAHVLSLLLLVLFLPLAEIM